MKKLLLSGLVMCSFVSYGMELQVEQEIPERYTLFKGVSEDGKLNKDEILSQFKQKCNDANVSQCQFIITMKGDKKGDGLLAFGEQRKDKKTDTHAYEEVGLDLKPTVGKIYENMIGYEIAPKDLYKAYDENEVVADEDFKDKEILLNFKIKEVAKDMLGKPYITTPVDQHGFSNIQVYLDKKDPFLRKIKKGSDVYVRAKTKGFVVKNVTMEGKIIHSKNPETMLVDGKAMTSKEMEAWAQEQKANNGASK